MSGAARGTRSTPPTSDLVARERNGVATVVVPCFNEAARLSPERLRRFVHAHPDVRFVLVDDGSTDGTGAILAQLAAADPEHFEHLASPANAGQGEAVRRGLLAAFASSSRYVGYWDADLAAPLEELPRFVALLDEDPACDYVYGARVRLLGSSVTRAKLRYVLGRVFAAAAARALDLDVYDTQCGAKLLRRTPDARALFERPFRTRWLFDVEILARLIARAGSAAAAASVVRELPLRAWREVPGTKLRWLDFVRAPLELLAIHAELRGALRARLGRGQQPQELGSGTVDAAQS